MERTINLLLTIILILFSGKVGWKRLKQKNVTCIFYGFYFMFFGISNLIRYIFHIEYIYPPGVLLPRIYSFPIYIEIKSNFLNILILFSWYIGENVFYKTQYNSPNRIGFRKPFFAKLMWFSLVFSILGIMILLWSKGISLSLQAFLSYTSRLEHRVPKSWLGGVIGANLISFVTVANYISLLRRNYLVTIICFLISIFLLTLTGTRAYLLYFIGPFLYFYIKNIIKNIKIKKKHIIATFLFLLIIPSISEIIRTWRWSEMRTLEKFLKTASNIETYQLLLRYPLSELNIYSYFLNNAVLLFPEQQEWLYGNTYKNIFLFWLPSGLSKGLKVDTIYLFEDALVGTSSSYQERRSMHPTFTGDCYINFGWLCWVPAFFWGSFFSFFENKARNRSFFNILAGSCIVKLIVYLFRGSIYLGVFSIIVLTGYLIVFRIFYSVIVSVSIKNKNYIKKG